MEKIILQKTVCFFTIDRLWRSHGECRIKNALEEAMEKLDNEVIEEMGENPNGTHHHLCCQWLDLTNSVVIKTRPCLCSFNPHAL